MVTTSPFKLFAQNNYRFGLAQAVTQSPGKCEISAAHKKALQIKGMTETQQIEILDSHRLHIIVRSAD